MARTFKEWCESTTCHGFGHLTHAKSKKSIILWSTVIILCVAILVFQLFQLGYSLHTSDKWTTKVYQKRADSLPFPTITICPYNRLDREKLIAGDFDEETHVVYFFSYFVVSYYDFLYEEDNKEYFSKIRDGYIKWKMANNMTFEKIFKRYGFSCKDLFSHVSSEIVKSKKLNRPCEATMEEDKFEIKPVFTLEFGRCFEINFHENITTRVPGTTNSIVIELEMLTSALLQNKLNNYVDNGFAVQLTYGSTEVGQWLNVMQGYHTWMAMQQKRNTFKKSDPLLMFPPPCDDNPSSKMTLLTEDSYNVVRCTVECEFRLLAEKCQCYPWIKTKKYPICEVEQWESCQKESKRVDKKKNSESAIKECQNQCLPLCNDKQIQTSVSLTSSHLMNPDNALIDIYYSSMELQVTELYQLLSIDQILGIVGGQCGLWMGVSMLTIAHLFVSLTLYCCEKKTNTVEYYE